MRRALQIMRACTTACGAFFGSLSPAGTPAMGVPLANLPAALNARTAAAAGARPSAPPSPKPKGPPSGAAAVHLMHARLRSFGQQPSADVGASLPLGMVPMPQLQ